MESYEDLYERIKGDSAAFQKKLAADATVTDGDVIPSIQAQTQTYMEWGYLHAKAEADHRRAKYFFQEDTPAQLRQLAAKPKGQRDQGDAR